MRHWGNVDATFRSFWSPFTKKEGVSSNTPRFSGVVTWTCRRGWGGGGLTTKHRRQILTTLRYTTPQETLEMKFRRQECRGKTLLFKNQTAKHRDEKNKKKKMRRADLLVHWGALVKGGKNKRSAQVWDPN